MKSYLRSALLLCGLGTVGAAYAAKEISLSFDDAPRSSTEFFLGRDRTKELVAALRKAKAGKVVFFCNTVRFDREGRNRIEAYTNAGHLIANHTHNHPSLNKVSPKAFWEQVVQADDILKVMPNYRKWMRYPFLHEGPTKETRDFMRGKLKETGYLNGYVTVDTYDWYVDSLVQRKKLEGYKVDLNKLRTAYVTMLVDGVEFYDKLAVKTLGRSPKHTLLLHENDLAAMYIGDLIAALRARGWKIISPDEAYADPIAQREPDSLVLNQGRIAALAREKGMEDSIWSKWEEEKTVDGYLESLGVFSRP